MGRLSRVAAAVVFLGGCAADFHRAQDDGSPGKWRWDVKTLTDDSAKAIDPSAPTALTVREASLWLPPAEQELRLRTPRGVRAQEYRAFRVIGEAVAFKFEPDGDCHLLITDPGDTVRLGVEIVNPDFAQQSPFFRVLQVARHTVEQRFPHPTRSEAGYTSIPRIPVSVVGVGFWDERHGERGLWNGFELHPVLWLAFR